MAVAANTAADRFRHIIEGGTVDGDSAMPGGRFRATDGVVRVEDQPEGLFSGPSRGYELDVGPVEEGDETGAVTTANNREGSLTITVRVAHAQGPGEPLHVMYARMAEDTSLLRQALEDSMNWDNQVSNICRVQMLPANRIRAIPPDPRWVLEVPFRLRVMDDYPLQMESA